MQGGGRAGGDFAEGKQANLDQQTKMQQWKLQSQEIQQRLGMEQTKEKTELAPQVVHTYRGSDGKMHNLVRNPLDGKITDQAVEGATQMSPDQQKLTDAQQALGRDLTPDEKAILVGVASKPSGAQESIKMVNGVPVGIERGGKIITPGGPGWTPQDDTTFKQSVEAYHKATAQKSGSKVNPIISAQIGKPPDASVYPGGEDDPVYKAKMKRWGIEAETITNRMAQQRGISYNMSRPGAYVTPEGELVTATASQAMQSGYIPATPAFNAMSKNAQFNEMQGASGKLRDAVGALEPGDAFNAQQVAQLNLAMKAPDEHVFGSVLSNLAASGLNDRQQDYVLWLQQMGERILSLRNVAGMGQGAQDLRAAIQATLPGINSGSKEFALKKLDAVDNQIKLLRGGIPKVSGMNTGGSTANTPPPGAKIIKWEDVK